MPSSMNWVDGAAGGTPVSAANLNKLAVTADVGTAGTPTGDALRAAYVPKWKANTAYVAGEPVINPSGQTVTANTNFTSGSTYSAGSWTVVSGGGGGGTVSDATTGAKGVVQLAGDLAGTAAAPTVAKIGGVAVLLSDTRPGSPTTGLVRIGLAASGNTAPGAPTGLGATAGNAQAALTWTAPASNGGATITDYIVQYRTTAGPGSWTTFADGTSTGTTATVTGLTNGTGYDFQVAAVNSVGTGTYSATASATPSSGADTTAPTAPTSLAAGTPTSTTIPLTWVASTDNVGVVAYDVYNSGTLLQSGLTGTSGTVTGLTASTAYVLTLKARDAAGNVSTASNSVSVSTASGGVTTLAADTFTRADGNGLGTSSGGQTWTVVGGRFDISTNQAKIGSYGAIGSMAGGSVVIDTGAANCTVSVDLPTIASTPGLVLRYIDASNHLAASHNNLTGRIGGTVIGNIAYSSALASGDTLVAVLSGSSVTIKKVSGGVTTTVATFTDTGLTAATKHGLSLNTTGSTADRWDNFLVTSP